MTIKFQAKHKSGYTVDKLTPFSFPAGEAHIKGFSDLNPDDYEYFIADIRGHDPQDLFHLAMWASGLDAFSTVEENNYPTKYVLLPYIPGARADRGKPFGASVYANFINGLFLDKVIILDPHSIVAPSLYENSENYPTNNTHEFPFERIIRREITKRYDGVIAPDKGAHLRASRAAAVLGIPVFTAGKVRDPETGKLSSFHMEDELPENGQFLIVDDICDGGGTFIGQAEAIKALRPNVKLDLWVTHGVFSRGTEILHPHFETIHTTNSYLQVRHDNSFGPSDSPDEYWLDPERVKVHDITPYLYNEVANVHSTLKAAAHV